MFTLGIAQTVRLQCHESQHHADESADNESVQLCETSTSESGTDSTASEDDEATDNGRTTLRGRGQARSGGHG